jgi:putative spermidine/putrescine transport system permease protein
LNTGPALALLFLSVFYLLPLIKLIGTSIEFPSLTLKHYSAFFGDAVYIQVLLRTLKLGVVTTLFCILLGYPVAYFLNHTSSLIRQVCLLLIVLPYLTSFLVRSYALIVLLSNKGAINGILIWFDIINEPFKLVFNTLGVHIGMIHMMLPFMILPLYAAMTKIDHRLTLAAYSLGAGPLLSFMRVYFPLSIPGLTSGSILVLIVSLGFYITPALLGGIGDLMLVNIIDIHATQLGNWDFAATASVILLGVTIVGFILIGYLSGEAGLVGMLTGDTVRSHGKVFLARWLKFLMASFRSFWRLFVIKRFADRLKSKDRHVHTLAPSWLVIIFFKLTRWVSVVIVCATLIFLISPNLIVIPMSFTSAEFVTFPPPGWSTKWYVEFFNRQDWIQALFNSIQVGIGSSLLSTLFGTLTAYVVVKKRFFARNAVVFMFISPIIVPPIIIAIGLYGYYVDWGLFGTLLGLTFAHSIGGTAFAFVSVSATVARFDFNLEKAAMSLGARPLKIFFSVTLPLIKSGVATGALFSFIYSFDELVITMLMAGIYTETLPLKIWGNIRNEIDPVIASVSVLLILLPILWVILLSVNQRRSRKIEIGV